MESARQDGPSRQHEGAAFRDVGVKFVSETGGHQLAPKWQSPEGGERAGGLWDDRGQAEGGAKISAGGEGWRSAAGRRGSGAEPDAKLRRLEVGRSRRGKSWLRFGGLPGGCR